MLVAKVHNSYRVVVALCDAELIGKRFEQDIRELEIRATFFKEQELNHEQAVTMLQNYAREDATFFIAGHKAIHAAKEASIITEDNIATIDSIPFTLILM